MIRLLLILSLLLASCAQPVGTQLAAESGFGGTGLAPSCPAAALLPGDSGFGGTGHASDCGFGGTGVIGTITDFGSIWVNGLEIELMPGLSISSNLGHPVPLAVGQQVITQTRSDALVTNRVEVFYPVAGQIQQREQNRIIVNGETIILDAHTRGLKTLQAGEWIAVSALPQGEHEWLATRIDPNPSMTSVAARPSLETLLANKALVEGGVVIRGGTAWLEPYHLKLGDADSWRNHPLALAVLQRSQAQWQLTAVRALKQWRVDWHELVHGQRERMMLRHELQERRAHRNMPKPLHERLQTLKEERDALKGQRETLKAQREALRENRETIEDSKHDFKAQHETLHEQKSLLEEQRDTLKAQQEQLKEQRETLKEQREMVREQKELQHDQDD